MINTDFARQVVFVSSQLDVSEYHIAGLMQSIISRHPNLASQPQQQASGSEKLVEAAILEFHAKRRQLAECLRYIVEAAVLGQQGVNEFAAGSSAGERSIAGVYRQLELFVRQEILQSGQTSAAAPSGSGLGIGRSFGGGAMQQGMAQGGFPMKLLREVDVIGETMDKVKMAKQNAKSDTVGPSQTQGQLNHRGHICQSAH